MTIKNLRVLLIFAFIVLLFSSCPRPRGLYGYKYDTGWFPGVPINLRDINTVYDDYNATVPYLGETFPLCFSSNRNSKGNDFDIVYKLMSIEFSRSTGNLKVYNNTNTYLDVAIENENIKNALQKINTSADEFGPYLIPQGMISGANNILNRYRSHILLYSTNIDGDQDIMMTHNISDENYITPQKVSFLNSEFDDAYPTFNWGMSRIYFCSNREGVYNIYYVETDSTKDILEKLQDTTSTVLKDTILSSDYDDKCPFIAGNLLVFASNRPGGYGGFDLYYSVKVDGKWTPPVNFGSPINTEYDEYRPIVRREGMFINDFMMFSSNRPGGKGGFDLYYVGIKKFE